MSRAFLFLCVACFLFITGACRREQRIVLNEKEYFSGPGFSFLVFHNNYQAGSLGGLEMIQNGERVLSCGDLFVSRQGGQGSASEQRVLRRIVERERSTATLFAQLEDLGLNYQLVCRTDGRSMFIKLQLDSPLDWSKVQQAGFRILLYPAAYFSKSFQGESGYGVFARQYGGRPVLLDGTSTLRIAQEDPLYGFTMRRAGGTLELRDNRRGHPRPWFSVVAALEPGSRETEVNVEIIPSLQPEWRRVPVIGVSQVGYHPDQAKEAVLELDPREEAAGTVKLYKLELGGDKRLAKSTPARHWGRFLGFQYATFDFSEVREPGLYLLEYKGQAAGPFRIAPDVYDRAWQPTLQWFVPVQMCHVAVREGVRVWHGACHLDDALQAPAGKRWLDGHVQGERETRFSDNQHIPGLNWGGWHDAGDLHVPATQNAGATLTLALAQEEFQPDLDGTTIRRAEREVLLHTPDGRPDLLQQVEYGAETLLAFYDPAAGHVYQGIMESSQAQYSRHGDPVNATDNRVYDPRLKPGQVVGDRSGTFDDRWVFTNRHTGLQYEVVQALAAASRVLRDNPKLAAECLKTARKIWEFEQIHPPVYPPRHGVGDTGFRTEEISATAELLLTTGEMRYRKRLLALLPVIRSISAAEFGYGLGSGRVSAVGSVLVRLLPVLDDAEFRGAVVELARNWNALAGEMAASNPWRVRFPREIVTPEYKLETPRAGRYPAYTWGYGGPLKVGAIHQYYFHKHLPEVFDKEPLLAVLNYVLGSHPATNESYVSGVGARSKLIAYGFNRAYWTYIPGGIVSGASLVAPDYMELKSSWSQWYQAEYSIQRAAAYIFNVLAAQKLLRQTGSLPP